MVIDDIIALLREESRNAKVTDNERIDDRLWEAFVMLTRSQFIKNHLNEKGYIEQNTLQFEHLTLTPYDSALTDGGVSLGKYIMRSSLVPKMIESRVGPAVFEISTMDIESKTLAYVPMDRLRWCGNGVVNRNMLYAAFYDDRFYVKSKSGLNIPTLIKLVGIFADPTEVSTYVRATSDYPVNEYMIKYMVNMVLTADINDMLGRRADVVNDASGDINE